MANPITELDEKYFREIFHKYYNRVYSVFYSKTGSDAVAQDLAQTTFIKIWTYRAGFSFDVPEEAQVFRKTRLVFIDWLRKNAHQRKLEQELMQMSEDKTASQFELTDMLVKALEQLPPMRKKVFSLSHIDGFSNKEIAEQLHLSVRTVEWHIRKALEQMRKIITWETLTILLFAAGYTAP